MRIFLDIDKTLTVDDTGFGEEVYRNRMPKWDTIKLVQELARRGHKITLFTSRFSKDMDVTIKWLQNHGVPFEEILFDKPKYDVFLDDKSTDDLERFVEMINKSGG